MIKSTDLRAFINKVLGLEKESDDWLSTLNPEIAPAFFDNTYVNNTRFEFEAALKLTTGDLYDDISWFLFEWQPGFHITIDDKKYEINNVDDYFNYLETEHLVEI